MPFWSSLSRVQRIVSRVPAYAGFEPVEITWTEFRDEWLVTCARDGMLVGVNWSGIRATGYDLDPEFVRRAVEAGLTGGNE